MLHMPTPDQQYDLSPPDSTVAPELQIAALKAEVARLKAERTELLVRLRVSGQADYVARLENERAGCSV